MTRKEFDQAQIKVAIKTKEHQKHEEIEFLIKEKQDLDIIKTFIVILQYIHNAMGATKTDHFTDNQTELAVLAKALGHPARIAIMEYLLKVDTCICGDIVNELPLSQPTISQHLKELKKRWYN